jgi:hypothetical protein
MIREKYVLDIFYIECIVHLNIEMTADDFNLVRAL